MKLEEQSISQRGNIMEIIKMISKFNFYPGVIERLKGGYIVIHYTGSMGSAKQQCEYFAGGDRGASAHYFIDYNGDVYQSVEDRNSSWHCGSKTGYKHPWCRNANSIGIELCCRTTGDKSVADSNWYFEDATVASAIALTRELMNKYDVPADHVLRHFDVTGKTCPAPYVFNAGKHTWDQFCNALRSTSNKDSEIQNPKDSKKEVAKLGWDSFLSAGFSEIVAAAWLGNLDAESGLRPNNLQDSYEKSLKMSDVEYTAFVDTELYNKEQFYNDKAGYGLAQWTYWSRKKAMYEYIVEQSERSIGDARAQFSFLLYELSNNYSGLIEKLKTCKTVKEASDLILMQYEKPADQSDKVKNDRASRSQKFYEEFSGLGDILFSELKETVPFLAQVSVSDLNIRKGPGTDFAKTGRFTGKGTFTIVEVSQGAGSDSGWGLLKSYQQKRDGWVSLDFAKKVERS